MTKYKPIKDLTETFSGLPASKVHKAEFHDGIKVQVLTADAIGKRGEIDESKLKTAWVDKNLPERFFVQKSDIICPLRGMKFKPTLIKKSSLKNYQIITTSNNAIIRTDNTQILPEVLFFYLNSKWFKQNTIQKTQRNFILISLKTLKELEFPLATNAVQESLKTEYYQAIEVQDKLQKLVIAQDEAIEAKFLSQLIPNV